MERGQEDDFAGLAVSVLRWWEEAGVDLLVADAPRDWLKAPLPQLSPVLSEVEGRLSKVEAAGNRLDRSSDALRLGPQDQVYPERLREAASKGSGREGRVVPFTLPDQLALFHDFLRASDALPYAAPGAPRVCPSGDPAAGLMIMVAMPSAKDCGAGALLSGAAGRLFDRMLAAIGRSRETTYLAGLSCLRPPAGRLDPAGAALCAEVARHHVSLVRPKALLLMGDACARALTGLGAAQARGKVHEVATQAGRIKAVVTLPPDYLLSQPAAKALAWADLQLLMEVLQ